MASLELLESARIRSMRKCSLSIMDPRTIRGSLFREQESEIGLTLGVLRKDQREIQCGEPGISLAQGEILLIVDDDVVVHPLWLIKHLECYRVSDFDAVQGRVLPGVDPEGRPADPNRLREYNIPIVDYGDEICEIRGLTGTNISFKREVFGKWVLRSAPWAGCRGVQRGH